MINIFEVKETNNMVEHENLDVRTITIGISLLSCIDSDLKKLNENIYNRITSVAKDLAKVAGEIEAEYGIPIVNKRISGGTTVLQVMLTLMLCYALCAIHSGVVLHRRKVHSLQIWKRVFENMFLFVLLGGLVLSVGNYADIASLFMLEYLFLLFLCLVSFRFTLRLLIRLYYRSCAVPAAG